MALVKKVLRLDCGLTSETAEFYLVDTDRWTEKKLDDFAWEAAVEYASSYGIYPESDRPDDYDEENDTREEYTDDINGWWEDYNPEEHDGLICGCGEFPDFKVM